MPQCSELFFVCYWSWDIGWYSGARLRLATDFSGILANMSDSLDLGIVQFYQNVQNFPSQHFFPSKIVLELVLESDIDFKRIWRT